MNKPYVVSSDIHFLVNRWAREKEFKLVADWVFIGMREEFSEWMRQMFKSNFEFVSGDEILYGLESLIEDCGLPVISLDKVGFYGASKLDITRLVDDTGNDCGFGPRKNVSLNEQLRVLSVNSPKEVVLQDDVVFSGSHIEKVIDLLYHAGIFVRIVVAGIGIGKGIQRVKDLDVEIRCFRSYDEVIDEVCERDFYPGVPLSGRTLIGGGNIGVPYLLPFGNPVKWASIPPYFERDFSIRCIGLARDLFHHIGYSSDPIRPVRFCDLDRGVVGLPRDETNVEERFRQIQDELAAGFDFDQMEKHCCKTQER